MPPIQDDEIILTRDQERASDLLEQWWKSPEQFFYLAGYAGTGKTFTLKRILPKLGLDITNPEHVRFAAFTGKASRVLTDNGCAASTIHSTIYHCVPVLNKEATEKAQTRARLSGDPEWRTIKRTKLMATYNDENAFADCRLVVLDECSMINEYLWKDLIKCGTKILVIGDPGQLDPVEGRSPFGPGGRQPDVFLKEITRQEAGSPIIQVSVMAREGKRIPVRDWGAVVKHPKGSRNIGTEILAHDIAITGRNDTRKAINYGMVERLWPGAYNGPDMYPCHAGMKVVVRTNCPIHGVVNGDLGVTTGPHRWVSARDESGREQPPELVVPVLINGREIDLPCVAEVFRNYRLNDGKAQGNPTRAVLDYAYAITCHVSQGSQWDRVLLLDDGIFASHADKRSRWVYTAVTRARKHLTIIEV